MDVSKNRKESYKKNRIKLEINRFILVLCYYEFWASLGLVYLWFSGGSCSRFGTCTVFFGIHVVDLEHCIVCLEIHVAFVDNRVAFLEVHVVDLEHCAAFLEVPVVVEYCIAFAEVCVAVVEYCLLF